MSLLDLFYVLLFLFFTFTGLLLLESPLFLSSSVYMYIAFLKAIQGKIKHRGVLILLWLDFTWAVA